MNDLTPIFGCLTAPDITALQSISASLSDAWGKRQVFRTETEARCSVLNDASFPTVASKYWQSVREQTVMLDNLTIMSFDMRRNQVALKKARQKLAAAETELEKEEAQIDVDECLWKTASAEQVARDRVREIVMWEQLKQELDDGSFDTQQVNTHQRESLLRQLEQRASALNQATPQAEVLNVIGPLVTLQRYNAKQLDSPNANQS